MYVRKLDTTIIREISEGAHVINIETGEDFIVNEIGAIFLQEVGENIQEVDTIVKRLVDIFEGVSYEQIRNDFCEFLSLMEDKQIISTSLQKENVINNQLKNLHVDITTACNERCIHCYFPNSTKNEKLFMPLDTFRKVIDDFVELGGKNIIISGGEPLMHASIIQLLQYCGINGLNVSLLSNLTLLNEMHIKTLKSIKTDMVQTSVYSLTPTIHDGITFKKGSLSKTLSSIDKLLSEDIPVRIACLVMKQNKDDVLKLIKYAYNNHIDLKINHLILPQTNGDDSFVRSSELSIEQQRCLYCNMMDVDKAYAMQLLGINTNSEALYRNPKEFLKSNLCGAGVNNCAVSPDGNVYPCPEWNSFLLGNINSSTLSEIWQSSISVKLLRQINRQKNFHQCLSCEALNFCRRCLMLNEKESGGELLRVNQKACSRAFMLKDLVNSYNN